MVFSACLSRAASYSNGRTNYVMSHICSLSTSIIETRNTSTIIPTDQVYHLRIRNMVLSLTGARVNKRVVKKMPCVDGLRLIDRSVENDEVKLRVADTVSTVTRGVASLNCGLQDGVQSVLNATDKMEHLLAAISKKENFVRVSRREYLGSVRRPHRSSGSRGR